MLVSVTTDLPISADRACALAQRPAMFRHVVWPVIATGELPKQMEVGEEVAFRLWFFGVLPGWTHHLRLVSLDTREIYTNEHGGPVLTWNHRLSFESGTESSCRYTDEIEIRAGLLTLPTVLFAHLVFRWRHRRWRALAPLLE